MLDDLKYAVRQLRRNPGFTAAVVVTLALAIGVNTAVFSLLDASVLRNLPYPHPRRLAVLMAHEESMKNPARFNDEDSFDNLRWEAVRQNVPAVMAAISSGGFGGWEGVNLQAEAARGTVVRYVHSAKVSAHYFEVLGIEPVLGRGFTEDEDRPGAGRAAVLSYSLWRTAFHEDRLILGKAILLKSAPYTVVGVLPQNAQMPNPADLWTPLMPDDPHGGCAGKNCVILMRLKPGASWDEVRAQLAHMPPPRNANLRYERVWYYPSPVQAYAASATRAPMEILMLAVSCILLIACGNLAGLMLVRIGQRTPEMAMRLALGASRGRVLRQLWVENLLLAALGGAAGLGLAVALLPAIRHLLPLDMMPIGGVSLDGRVLAFAAAISLLTSVLFSALPALGTRRVDLRSSIAAGARAVTGGSGRLRQWLIACEVSLTVVLLGAAGLLIRTVIHLETLPGGFDAHNVVAAKASLDDARYHDPAAFRTLLRESVAAMQRIPGVESAAVALSLPYETFVNDAITVADGRETGTVDACSLAYTTPEYFSVLRIPLLAGRVFRDSDTPASQPVAIVNTAFGRHFFGEQVPLGRHFRSGKLVYTIVGVVADTLDQSNVRRDAPIGVEPIFYVPYTQVSASFISLAHMWAQPSWVVRTNGRVPGLTGQMQRALASVDPALPFAGFYSMQDLLNQQLQTQRLEVMLLGTLAALALLLSTVGIYALVSNLVVQRAREIGIRMALGSTAGQAMSRIASSGLVAASAGVAVGLGASFFVLRLMKSALYGVSPWDPLTLLSVPVVLIAVAAAASLLPALRVAHIDPAEALRAE